MAASHHAHSKAAAKTGVLQEPEQRSSIEEKSIRSVVTRRSLTCQEWAMYLSPIGMYQVSSGHGVRGLDSPTILFMLGNCKTPSESRTHHIQIPIIPLNRKDIKAAHVGSQALAGTAGQSTSARWDGQQHMANMQIGQ